MKCVKRSVPSVEWSASNFWQPWLRNLPAQLVPLFI